MNSYFSARSGYRLVTFIVLGLLAGTLAACAAQPAATPAPTDVVQDDVTETRNEADTDEQVIGAEDVPAVGVDGPAVTYTDEYGGYALDYPEGWLVEAGPRNSVSLTSADEVPADVSALADGQTLIQIVPAQADDGDFDTLLESQRQFITDNEGEITGEITLDLAGEGQAMSLSYTIPDTDEAVVYVANVNARDFVINGYGDLAMVEAVVGTLRPNQ